MLTLLLVFSPLAWANEAPVALAGRAFLAYPGERIVLNGSESSDPDGDALSFEWTQLWGPGTVLAKADTAAPEFDARLPGTYTFELVVGDGALDSEPDAVDVIVVDPAIGQSVDAGGCASAPGRTTLSLTLLALVGLARRRI